MTDSKTDSTQDRSMKNPEPYPTECVLCPNTEDTPEKHQQHMEDVHNV
jgi:hypothetical protein